MLSSRKASAFVKSCTNHVASRNPTSGQRALFAVHRTPVVYYQPAMDPLERLPINRLDQRHTGLTPALAQSFLEAARVCLDRHHTSPTVFKIKNIETLRAEVVWANADERCQNAWANEIDTTESGAYACALAASELVLGLVAVRRAETRTGADYYIAPPGKTFEDLEACFRFEVSGIDKGSNADVFHRLDQKVQQTKAGTSNLPAVAGVVGFGQRMIALMSVEDRR